MKKDTISLSSFKKTALGVIFTCSTIGFVGAAHAESRDFGPLYSTTTGGGYQVVLSGLAIPATSGDADLEITHIGDLDHSSESLTVQADGVTVGTIGTTGAQCAQLTSQFTVPNSVLQDGSVTLNFVASGAVHSICNGTAIGAPSSVSSAVIGTLSYETDTVPPTVAITSTATSPTSVSPIPVTVTFSEEVTNFVSTDISVTNGSVTGFSTVDNIVWSVSVTPAAPGDVTIGVNAAVAEDLAGNDNTAAEPLIIGYIDSAAEASEVIAKFLETRSHNLVQSQPGLTRFLSAKANGHLTADVTRGNADLSFATGGDFPIWFALESSKTDLVDGDTAHYTLATIGGHVVLNDGLLAGGMLQFDHARFNVDGDAGDVSGDGWLAGPYLVAQLGNQPLFFEGRLLFGESTNEVNPLGTFTDGFRTERVLGLVALEGSYQVERVSLLPRVQFSHVSDRQLAYVDGLSNAVSAQKVTMEELSVGVDFETLIGAGRHEQFFTWGLSGIWSKVEGSDGASAFIIDQESGRGRFDLGYVVLADSGLRASVNAFVDGIGADDFDTYGVSLNVDLNF